MIFPPDRTQALRQPWRPSRRERRILAGVVAVALALVVAVVLALASSGPAVTAGCVSYAFPYSVGGQDVYACGAEARRLCAQPDQAGNGTANTRQVVIAACRRARLPVG